MEDGRSPITTGTDGNTALANAQGRADPGRKGYSIVERAYGVVAAQQTFNLQDRVRFSVGPPIFREASCTKIFCRRWKSMAI